MFLHFFSLVNVCVWKPNTLFVDGNVGCVGNWKDGKVGGSDGGGVWKDGKVGGGGDKNGCWKDIIGGGGCGGSCCE